jgi:hypothetical protein
MVRIPLGVDASCDLEKNASEMPFEVQRDGRRH